ncbi:MAG: hypothetical protein CMF67_10175 [Magnetovibrio sp.]|nr:hypothetical protein [Magnetovibrio sp.]
MSTKSPIILIMTILLISLTGCISMGTAWNRQGANADQFAADKAACRSYAHREAGNTYLWRSGLDSAGGVNNNAEYKALMQRHDARQDARNKFERCLMHRGYRKVAPKSSVAKDVK